MRKLLLFLLFASISVNAQTFNKKLADSLGADEYGMRYYVLAILKTGPNKTDDKEKLNALFKGHMDNIDKMAKGGRLVVAGPMRKNANEYRGIFILNVKTIADAEKLLRDDPVIRERIMTADFYEWYGSAALPKYLPFHEDIRQKKP